MGKKRQKDEMDSETYPFQNSYIYMFLPREHQNNATYS